MNIKTIAVPAFVALSLIFTACAGDQTIETPDAVDGSVQDGIEGVEQGAEDAGNAAQDGAKNFQKGAEDAGNTAQDGVKQGAEDAGNGIKDLGDKIPNSQGGE